MKKHEFLENQKQIFELLEKGYSILQTYNIIKESNKITMKYNTFRLYILKSKIKIKIKEKKEKIPVPKKNEKKIEIKNEIHKVKIIGVEEPLPFGWEVDNMTHEEKYGPHEE